MDAIHRRRMDYGLAGMAAVIGLAVLGAILVTFWQFVLGIALMFAGTYALGYFIDRALLDGQPAGVEHVASKDCWCEPTQDTEEPSVYIHRSKDDGH